MFTWLKKLFGADVPDTPVIAQEKQKETPKAHIGRVTEITPAIEPTKKPKKAAAKTKAKKGVKKSAPKKTETSDLNSLNKSQLLEEAKKRGVKANASLKKDEILERIKNG